jgi:hypothetical protein
MKCSSLSFSRHAIERMYEREITPELVHRIIDNGEVIASYPDDKPHPSVLMLGFEAGRPVHVLVAQNMETGECVVITVYPPDRDIWSSDFRTRRRP